MSKGESISELKSLIDKIRSDNEDQKTAKLDTIFNSAEKTIRSYAGLKSSNEKKVFEDFMTALATNPSCHRIAAKIDPLVFEKFGRELLKMKNVRLIPSYLEIFRSPKFLTRIYDEEGWSALIQNLLSISNYTFPNLFFHRVNKYKNKITQHTKAENKKKVAAYTKKLEKAEEALKKFKRIIKQSLESGPLPEKEMKKLTKELEKAGCLDSAL